MMKNIPVIFSILIEGKAGQGANAVARAVGKMLAQQGYFVFVSRHYGSFVRGGYNCDIITFSDSPIMSNESKIDILVTLDENLKRTYDFQLKKEAISLKSNGEGNMFFTGKIAKILGIESKILEESLKEFSNFKTNLEDARKGYNNEETKIPLMKLSNKVELMDGAHAFSIGAINSGLDNYFFYPMTPATSIANYLADKQKEKNIFIFELEDEIAVINAALGSAITGAKSMIGTSGGGFDLMSEALSLAGMAEIPIVIYLAQRPGPSTGIATYTSQGDLDMIRHTGHGEFQRAIFAAGDSVECQELASWAFYFSQKFKIPCFVLTDKHLAESLYSINTVPKMIKSEKSTLLKRYNSYEHDADGEVTDISEVINKSVERRLKKQKEIEEEIESFESFRLYGNKNSKNLILFWGSTKGAVLDSIKNMDVKAMQFVILEPFSNKIKAELERAENIIIVENNSTSQLSKLIAEKTGIIIKNKILRYDGTPFISDELNEEIKRRLI
jgi:2-oxoglutarate/2-oxoacid ferredoxin oxidoreductase subunit alpha